MPIDTQDNEIYAGSRLTMREVIQNIFLNEFEKSVVAYKERLVKFFADGRTHLCPSNYPDSEKEERKRVVEGIIIINTQFYKTLTREFFNREVRRVEKIRKFPGPRVIKTHLHYYARRGFEEMRDEIAHYNYMVPPNLQYQVPKQRRVINQLVDRLSAAHATPRQRSSLNFFSTRCVYFLAIAEITKGYSQSEINKCVFGEVQHPPTPSTNSTPAQTCNQYFQSHPVLMQANTLFPYSPSAQRQHPAQQQSQLPTAPATTPMPNQTPHSPANTPSQSHPSTHYNAFNRQDM